MEEFAALGGIELQAGRDARRQRRLVGVHDGVGEAADARDDRRGAIAQRAELRQAAGLEARGNDQEIDAGLDEMRELLVIAEHAADRALVLGGGGGEALLERRLAGAQQRRAAPPRRSTEAGPRAAGRAPSGWSAGRRRRTAARSDRRSSADLLLQRGAIAPAVVDAQCAVVLRRATGPSPDSRPRSSMPLTMPSTTSARVRISPSSAMPNSGVMISRA